MSPRLAGTVLALVAGAGCVLLSGREELPAPWLAGWRQQHPGPRRLGEAGERAHGSERGRARAEDAWWLLLGLAAGGAVLAVAPELATRCGGGLPLVLASGSLAVGLVAAARGGLEIAGRARDGHWTLGEDNLVAVAGPLAPTLRDWRERIGEDEAVLVVGLHDYLLNLVAWALWPRPVHPVVLPVPPGMDAAALRAAAAALPQGQGARGRWLVDLEALADEASGRPALMRLDG